jgi:hypothetical protein
MCSGDDPYWEVSVIFVYAKSSLVDIRVLGYGPSLLGNEQLGVV